MIPLSILTWPRSARAVTPPPPSPTCWNWPSMPMRWATAATGWPNHNMPGIASAATAVLIGHVAGGAAHPRQCRRHHAAQPCAAAGGRAVRHAGVAVSGPHRSRPGPCAEHRSADCACTAPLLDSADQFRRTCASCCTTSSRYSPGRRCRRFRAVACGCRPGSWSSLFGARMAAAMGLPYAFASHRARRHGRGAGGVPPRVPPSATLKQPHAMLALNVVASDSEAESRRLFTSQQQSFVNLRRGRPGKIPAPIDDIEAFWEPHEKLGVGGPGLHRARRSAAGGRWHRRVR